MYLYVFIHYTYEQVLKYTKGCIKFSWTTNSLLPNTFAKLFCWHDWLLIYTGGSKILISQHFFECQMIDHSLAYMYFINRYYYLMDFWVISQFCILNMLYPNTENIIYISIKGSIIVYTITHFSSYTFKIIKKNRK